MHRTSLTRSHPFSLVEGQNCHFAFLGGGVEGNPAYREQISQKFLSQEFLLEPPTAKGHGCPRFQAMDVLTKVGKRQKGGQNVS